MGLQLKARDAVLLSCCFFFSSEMTDYLSCKALLQSTSIVSFLFSLPPPLPSHYDSSRLEDRATLQSLVLQIGGHSVQFSSVQFKVVSVCLEKPICAPPCLRSFPQSCLWNGSSVHWLEVIDCCGWAFVSFSFAVCLLVCISFSNTDLTINAVSAVISIAPPPPRPALVLYQEEAKKRCMLTPFCFQDFSLWSEISSFSKVLPQLGAVGVLS